MLLPLLLALAVPPPSTEAPPVILLDGVRVETGADASSERVDVPLRDGVVAAVEAEILGLGDALGSVEPGKIADIVVASGDRLPAPQPAGTK